MNHIILEQDSKFPYSIIELDNNNNITRFICRSYGYIIELNPENYIDMNDVLVFDLDSDNIYELFLLNEIIHLKKNKTIYNIPLSDLNEEIINFFNNKPYSTLFIDNNFNIVLCIDNVLNINYDHKELYEHFNQVKVLKPIKNINQFKKYILVDINTFKFYCGYGKNIINYNQNSSWKTCKICLNTYKERKKN